MGSNTQLYKFRGSISWELINTICEIDRFDGLWAATSKKDQSALQKMRAAATIESVGASTRIEGSKMTDADVRQFLSNLDTTDLGDRDSQEVAGYYSALELIMQNSDDLLIETMDIRSLHNALMKFNSKDEWHRGNYKQHSNAVVATFVDGSRQIIFKTTPPGIQTEREVEQLARWYADESDIHPLIKSGILAYEFLTIHPFQDGNGRLSRLLTTLGLLQNGYEWIQYVSFENQIESTKASYYASLRSCQVQRPNEDITEWINYFTRSLRQIKLRLKDKIQQSLFEDKMSPSGNGNSRLRASKYRSEVQ